ncbi:MAG: hypothetical protein WCP57_07460 [Bacteroidota bacterium]
MSHILIAQVNTMSSDSTQSTKLLIHKPQLINNHPLNKLPNYYTPSLGVFCKAELVFQKQINMPIKFRLGTLQYCDKYEGKH